MRRLQTATGLCRHQGLGSKAPSQRPHRLPSTHLRDAERVSTRPLKMVMPADSIPWRASGKKLVRSAWLGRASAPLTAGAHTAHTLEITSDIGAFDLNATRIDAERPPRAAGMDHLRSCWPGRSRS
jgi:hypothetical protein